MGRVQVRTIVGVGYTVDEKQFTLESDQYDAPGYVTGVRLSVDEHGHPQNVFIPMTNIDRIIWDT